MKSLAFVVVAASLALAACASAPPAQEGFGERMSKEHAGDAPEAAAAKDAGLGADAPERPVIQSEVVYGQQGEVALRGVLSVPEGATAQTPAVIVIHEWWGLNDNVKEMSRRLSAQGGYVTLAVDMYAGQVATSPSSARALMDEVFRDPAAGEANLRQALGFLKARGASKAATLGWCFGGGWSLQSAVAFGADLDAAVIYYGHVSDDPKALAQLKAPLLGIFGGQDQGIPVADVERFAAAVKAAGGDLQLKVYEAEGHAFANPSGKAYSPDAARDAWDRTLKFLAQHLR
jgi:carboxymethylenebutenolidase